MSDENGDQGNDDTGSGDDAPPAKTFTQADLDKHAGRRAAEAAKKAEKDLKDYLAAEKQKLDLAAMDDASRATAEADRIKSEALAIKAEAAAERLAAKVERKLLAAGVPETALTRATRMVSLDADASDDDIAAEVDAIKEAVPGLFTPSSTAPGTPPAPGAPAPAPAKPPTGGAATGTPKEIAAEMFRRRGLPTRSEKTAA